MELLRLIEGIRTPFLNSLFELITRLGEETIGVVILCAIFWCISKRIGYIIGVVYFLSGLTVQGMKIVFRIDRPWVADTNFKPVPAFEDYPRGYSFPSGHTQSATALFGTLGVLIKQKPVKVVCFLVALLVGFSRMYLGVHTLQDVLASLLISSLFILISVLFMKNEEISKKRSLIISLVMVAYAAIVAVIALVLYNNGTIEEEYISDCLKSVGAGVGFAVGMYIERVYINFPVKSKNILMQVLKFIFGIAGVLAIQEGLKLIIGKGLAVDTLRYFLMISWVVVFYPIIIKRLFKAKESES